MSVELSVLPTTRVADVKHRLREAWPPALLERRRSSGSSCTSSSTHTPSRVQPRHQHHHTYNDYHEELSESEDEDEDEEEKDEEEDDDGTVASCSGAGPPPSLRLRAPDVDRLRLICMGQGLLTDSRRLQGMRSLFLGLKDGRRGGGRGEEEEGIGLGVLLCWWWHFYMLSSILSILLCPRLFKKRRPLASQLVHPSTPHHTKVANLSFLLFPTKFTQQKTECHIPSFTTHPTPVNVSIRPPPPRPPGQGKRGQQKKKKTKTLDDEQGGREGVGAVVPTGCVSCTIM